MIQCDRGGYLVFLPDYDIGFVCWAGRRHHKVTILMRALIADLVTAQVLPTLEAQAATMAEQNFART